MHSLVDSILLINFILFKLYFIVYAITVVPDFPPLPPTSTKPPPLPQAIPTSLSMSLSHVYTFFGYSILYAVLYIPNTIL